VIRPLSVWLGLLGVPATKAPRRLLGWFGIRGIGSVYYAVYIAGHELEYPVAAELVSIVFTVIAASIVVHGISATPLMVLYQRRRGRLREATSAVSDKR
jgi:NhaP-type Na+/H+ or K+/H+ antiporter